jgi:acyl-coenzyme A synthetase/AMP-(fatty) acid ligase
VRNESPASYAGVVSIGNTFGSNKAVIVDENLRLVADCEKGELCISGDQVASGYWRNDKKTREAFFEMDIEGEIRRFYRTGDLAFRNKVGEYMYCGRMDAQVQIQGYRVELGEIESHARDFLQMSNLACVSRENQQGITEIFLIIENAEDKEDQLKSYLQSKLPRYMIPRMIINFNELPKSAGGKINKSEILKLLNNEL